MSDLSDNNHPVPTTAATQTDPRSRPASLSDRVRSLRLDRPTRAPAERSWLPWILCLILAGASGYLGYRTFVAEPAAEADKAKASAAEADAKPARTSQGRVALEAGGYIVPVRRVQVSPKVGGEVVELRKVKGVDGKEREIEEGDYVEKGQWIARLDQSKYDFEYRRMQALADQAKAEYDKLVAGNREEEKKQTEAAVREAEYQRDQFKDEYTRLEQSRLASSVLDRVQALSRLNQAEYKVKQLEQVNKMMHDGPRKEDINKAKNAYLHAVAQRDNAKYDLDNTEVVAPISGVVLIKRAEVGNTVRPEAFSNGLSASVCEMADLTKLEVDVDISERDLNRVFPGQKCEVRTEADPGRVYQGEVSRFMPEANRSKASVSARVRIEVPEDERHLRPELRARVTFLSPSKESATEKDKSPPK